MSGNNPDTVVENTSSTKPDIVVEITINDIQIKSDLHKELLVGEGDINIHIDELPSRLLHWSLLKCRVDKMKVDKQNDFDMWLAEQKSGTGVKTSETAKEDAVIVKSGGEYARRINELADLNFALDKMSAIVKAWEAKQEMLISLSSNYRHEMATGIRLKEWDKKVNKILNQVEK